MPTFGRKPSGSDIAHGVMSAGQIRGTIAGRVSANGWLYRFGARVGKQAVGGANATYQQALYRASGGSITSREGVSDTGTASTVMTYGGNGANQTVKPTAPIMVRPGIDYALPIRAVSGDLAHGMDLSGTTMHDRTTGSFPDPFGATYVRPEGRLSTWCDIQTNLAPNKPSGVFPAPGDNVVTSPTMAANFRDDDEVLPGFSLGDADRVSAYRFEIWNLSRTTRLRDSGKLTATAPQQAARRVTWTPSTLAAGSYLARCTVWDMFGVPSPQVEWGFTINAGGAVTVAPDPAHILGEQGGWPITNTNAAAGNTMTIKTTWTHSSGLSATEAALRVRAPGGTIVRAEIAVAVSIASGGSHDFSFTNGSGTFGSWAALTGGQRYSIEARFKDSAGAWTTWASSGQFLVNAAPGTPTGLLPASGAYGEPPLLSAIITDVNDSSGGLAPSFAVRAAGDPGDGLVIPVARRTYASGRHYAQANATEFPAHGTYQWRVRATDVWGRTGAWTGWQSLTYAEPPQITITSPTAAAVLDHGTPTIAYTVDRSISHERIRVWHDTTGALVYEHSSATTGSSGSHAVAVGVLRNLTGYEAEVEVTGLDGLVGRATVSFSIAYDPPPALAAVTAEPTPGPFESAQPETGWSQIEVAWSEPSLTDAPADDFQGYVVRVTAVSTGVETIAAVIRSRGERVWIFRTPTSGEVYTFAVTYLVEINEVDTVESEPATVETGVSLADTVIITLDEDALGAPLRFWEEREADWVTDVEIVPSWTEHPIGFQGTTNSSVISGTFLVLDDELGSYTARDIVLAVRAIAGPKRDAAGRIRPRVICYRDPRGRNEVVMLSAGGETDWHRAVVGELSLTFTRVAVDLGAVIGTAGLEAGA